MLQYTIPYYTGAYYTIPYRTLLPKAPLLKTPSPKPANPNDNNQAPDPAPHHTIPSRSQVVLRSTHLASSHEPHPYLPYHQASQPATRRIRKSPPPSDSRTQQPHHEHQTRLLHNSPWAYHTQGIRSSPFTTRCAEGGRGKGKDTFHAKNMGRRKTVRTDRGGGVVLSFAGCETGRQHRTGLIGFALQRVHPAGC